MTLNMNTKDYKVLAWPARSELEGTPSYSLLKLWQDTHRENQGRTPMMAYRVGLVWYPPNQPYTDSRPLIPIVLEESEPTAVELVTVKVSEIDFQRPDEITEEVPDTKR